MRHLSLLAALLMFVAATARAADTIPPDGTYTNDDEEYSLKLSRSGDTFNLVFTVDDETYRVSGTLQPDNTVRGVYIEDGERIPWSLSASAGALALIVEDELFTFPLAAPTKSTPPAATSTGTPATAPTGTLKFTRLSITDPQINNVEAVSMLIPEGWRYQGSVKWFPDYSILANLDLTITDPDSGAEVRFLPAQNFTWIDNPTVPMQPGQNYMGNIVYQPITDIPQFIQTFYAREPLTHLSGVTPTSVEPLSALERQLRDSWGGQARVHTGRVRYDYDRSGTPWREEVCVALVYNSQQGMTIWTVNSAYSFRAPADRFDALAPRMATTISTIRLGPDWFAGYRYVQQLFMNRMNQGIQNAAAISRTITENSEEIRRMYSDAYREQCASQDRISRATSESIRGVETYQNPYEDRPIQLPSGYRDAWVNAQGQYILSEQSGYDPNVGSTTEWRRMQTAP